MEFRIISLPPFKAAFSGIDTEFDFSPKGILGKFSAYFSGIEPKAKDAFMPRDFLYFDEEKQGMAWMWALADGMPDGGNEIVDFDGGLYLTYTYKDGDDEDNSRLFQEAKDFIQASDALELDVRPNHYVMGHVITPAKLIKAQGWSQMETFIPVKLKK